MITPMGTDAADGEGRLALEEPELRLPWLEAADEDLDEGLDWARIGKFAGFVVVILVLIAASAFGLRAWLASPPEGDGSLIEAPDTPYKVRPADRGGMTVAGTGDTSYKVGEGVDAEASLAEPAPTPTPVPAPASAATTAAAPSPAPAPTPELTGVAVQVGAYSTEAAARAGWATLRNRYEPLHDYDRRIVQGRADIGVVYRLQAIAPDMAGAFALCDDLRRNGIECQVKR